MGQLEKYGLYVLCLVIFLILGVAIWGEPPPAHAGGSNATTAMLEVPPPGKQPAASSKEVVASDALIKEIFADSVPGGGDKQKGKAGDDKSKANEASANKASNKPSNKPDADKNGADKNGTDKSGKNGTNPVPAPQADAKTTTYTVKDGDVLSSIAEKQLGSTRHVDAILKLNPKVDPRRIHAGDKLLLPQRAELAGTATSGGADKPVAHQGGKAATRSYTVADGDTYEAIAIKLFKSKARVDDIEKLNPGIDPKKLRPGKPIMVPVE